MRFILLLHNIFHFQKHLKQCFKIILRSVWHCVYPLPPLVLLFEWPLIAQVKWIKLSWWNSLNAWQEIMKVALAKNKGYLYFLNEFNFNSWKFVVPTFVVVYLHFSDPSFIHEIFSSKYFYYYEPTKLFRNVSKNIFVFSSKIQTDCGRMLAYFAHVYVLKRIVNKRNKNACRFGSEFTNLLDLDKFVRFM